MDRTRRRAFALGGLLAVAAAFGAPGVAAAGDVEVLATEREPTPITAYGGRVVWSSFDPETRRFWLMSHAGGRVERLPVRPRKAAFDADLGIGPDGAVTVVYSRCATEPMFSAAQSVLPNYAAGAECRLYRFGFRDRRERRVRTAGRAGRSEFLPTIWRHRIAFGRVGRPKGRPQLVLRSLASGIERRVRVPVRPGFREASGVLLTGTDLLGSRLVSAWQFQEVTCRRSTDPESTVEPFGTEVFAGTADRQRAVAVGCNLDDPQQVKGAEQSSESIFALAYTRKGTRLRAYTPRGRLVLESPPADSGTSLAVAERSVYYLTSRYADEKQLSSAYDIIRTSR